ncbi:MAG: SGNH/GDSL hydrolase family protein [Candidatus Poseidoniia archaeon]|nr:SGNH/GDSL hydrolase family protein [Candidatus Poseidoniia archaeon]
MKNLLCFGDSNTWGYSPVDGTRFSPNVRWTGVLQKSLGKDYRIIEEGLNGRTTFIDEDGRPLRSGSDVLPIILESHRPLDLVVIMLGTNDLKVEFDLTVEDIAQGAKTLCEMVINSEYLEEYPPEILLISPTLIGDYVIPEFDEVISSDKEFFDKARKQSFQFAEHYEKVASELGINFLDAAKIVSPSKDEGVHWDAEQHILFGKKLKTIIETIFLKKQN